MIVLQIFALSVVAGAGAYTGVAVAISISDAVSAWHRARGGR